jgi:hypothetical protein
MEATESRSADRRFRCGNLPAGDRQRQYPTSSGFSDVISDRRAPGSALVVGRPCIASPEPVSISVLVSCPSGSGVAGRGLKGGCWTKNWCGGASNGARVCLDVCGRDSSALGGFIRRRTSSDFLRFAPGGYGAVGGTHSASRRSHSFLAAPANSPRVAATMQ